MRNKPIAPIVLTFILGIAYHLYKGYYKDETDDIGGQVIFLVGGALGFVIAVTILPLIVSLVVFAKNKIFPARLFTISSYAMLTFIMLLLYVGGLMQES
ncbi:MAG TPA: hypothetical protein VF141_05425 [Chryseolinea sp.]